MNSPTVIYRYVVQKLSTISDLIFKACFVLTAEAVECAKSWTRAKNQRDEVQAEKND